MDFSRLASPKRDIRIGERAEHARRLAHKIANWPDIAQDIKDVTQDLKDIARAYDEMAADLETGAVEVCPPELMPQQRRD